MKDLRSKLEESRRLLFTLECGLHSADDYDTYATILKSIGETKKELRELAREAEKTKEERPQPFVRNYCFYDNE